MHKRRFYLWLFYLLVLFITISSCTHVEDYCDPKKKDCQSYNVSSRRNSTTNTTSSSNQCHVKKDTPEPQTLGAGVIYMVAGVYLSTGGFMFFRSTVFIIGGFVGSFISWFLLQLFEPKEGYPNCHNVYLSVGLASGLVLGGFLLLFYEFSIPLLGLSTGLLVYTYVQSWRDGFIIHQLSAKLALLGALMVVFFFLSLFCEFVTVILSLSILGGYGFLLGLDMMVRKKFYHGFQLLWNFNQQTDEYRVQWEVIVYLCCLLGWVIVTAIWQLWLNKGTRFGIRVIKNTNDTLAKIK